MSQEIINIKKELVSCIKAAVSKSNGNVFQNLQTVFTVYFNKPCNNMVELKKKNTRQKGLVFEVFCMMYLQAKGYEVWMLSECPPEILEQQGLKSFDMGIDLIARFKNNGSEWLYVPIQCKYRSVTKDKFGRDVCKVGWKDISTFISLCARTGKWIKNIIMTNADSVRWGGKKSKFDYVMAKKTFEKCNNLFWLHLAGLQIGNKLGTAVEPLLQFDESDNEDSSELEEKKEIEIVTSIQQVPQRLMRQQWLDKISKNEKEK